MPFEIYIFIFILLILPPFAVFCVGPKASMWVKSIRLVIPAIVLILMLSFIASPDECWGDVKSLECRSTYVLAMLITVFASIAYIGWFEFLWRIIYKQFSRNVIQNFRYGIVSAIVIVISMFCTPILLWMVF
jgi:hypothetical protein